MSDFYTSSDDTNKEFITTQVLTYLKNNPKLLNDIFLKAITSSETNDLLSSSLVKFEDKLNGTLNNLNLKHDEHTNLLQTIIKEKENILNHKFELEAIKNLNFRGIIKKYKKNFTGLLSGTGIIGAGISTLLFLSPFP